MRNVFETLSQMFGTTHCVLGDLLWRVLGHPIKCIKAAGSCWSSEHLVAHQPCPLSKCERRGTGCEHTDDQALCQRREVFFRSGIGHRLSPVGLFLGSYFQNSKSRENWIWRAPVPAMGCLNPGDGVKADPKTGLTSETFDRFSRLKASTTT